MFYVLHGADFVKRNQKVLQLTETLLSKKPNTLLVKINAGESSSQELDQFIGGQGLFEQKLIVVLNGFLENKENREEVLEKAEALSLSENIFITNDGEVLPKIILGLGEYAQKIQEFPLKAGAKSSFNIFALSDAIGARDRMGAWTSFLKSIEYGAEAEEIHGIILWQLKSIALAKSTKGDSDKLKKAGISPFVATKAVRYSKNYTESELKKNISDLVIIYHDSHRGILELPSSLEKFILETV